MLEERAYQDRAEAGAILADHVCEQAPTRDAVVLALPRGGVPIGREVAQAIDAPLDVFVVRKLGVPTQPELAMGAIASGGIKVLNDSVLAQLAISDKEIEQVARREAAKLERRERNYRGDRPSLEVRDHVAILVDDGLATGSTMRAAIAAVHQRGPRQLIVGVPVGAKDTCDALAAEADTVICPLQPEELVAIGAWYEDFAQTSDDEVREILARAHSDRSSPASSRHHDSG